MATTRNTWNYRVVRRAYGGGAFEGETFLAIVTEVCVRKVGEVHFRTGEIRPSEIRADKSGIRKVRAEEFRAVEDLFGLPQLIPLLYSPPKFPDKCLVSHGGTSGEVRSIEAAGVYPAALLLFQSDSRSGNRAEDFAGPSPPFRLEGDARPQSVSSVRNLFHFISRTDV